MARRTREGGWGVGNIGVDGGWLSIPNCYDSGFEGQGWGSPDHRQEPTAGKKDNFYVFLTD
jgi:hypothetical protein